MKALVIAERADAARELCAGARTMADEVVLVSFGEAPEAVADKIARISVPEGTVLDDAADTVISVFDAEAPAVVLVEPTRHMKTVSYTHLIRPGSARMFEGQTADFLIEGNVQNVTNDGYVERGAELMCGPVIPFSDKMCIRDRPRRSRPRSSKLPIVCASSGAPAWAWTTWTSKRPPSTASSCCLLYTSPRQARSRCCTATSRPTAPS